MTRDHVPRLKRLLRAGGLDNCAFTHGISRTPLFSHFGSRLQTLPRKLCLRIATRPPPFTPTAGHEFKNDNVGVTDVHNFNVNFVFIKLKQTLPYC